MLIDRNFEGFVRQMPKAELHVHIEGTLEPEMAFELAARNGVELPFASVAALRQAYDFSDLQSFLDVYYACAAVLVKEQDYYDLMAAYLRRAAADNVRHAEIFFDPQTHTARGIEIGAVISGLIRAIADTGDALGISAGLIMCFLRHLPELEAQRTWEAAMPFREHLLGIGLDSAELGNPPGKFAGVFAEAGEAGLHLVAHAGEEGPSEYIGQALDLLRVERIDHGVRCLDDPKLVARLVNEGVPLTVCPLSNTRLNVFPCMAAHNLKRLMDAGVFVTCNSDDPAYFGGYLNDNYLSAALALGLDREAVFGLARNSFEASFTDSGQQARWLKELDEYAGAVP